MADTTTPVIPAQDLQINLADAPKAEISTPENTPAELDLDLDLNLPEVPKNDDRLKTEDQKNQEITAPVVEATTVPVIEPAVEQPTIEPVQPQETKIEEIVIPEKIEPTPVAETKVEEVKAEIVEPSKVIEAEPIPTTAPAELKEDMKMIDELEGHASAGGLAPEAVVAPQLPPTETPKTFDLDAMLGGPINPPISTEVRPEKGGNEGGFGAEAQIISQPVEQKTEIPGMPPAATVAPQQMPTFTIPTTTTQAPVQAVMQTTIPHKKNAGVKALLFVVLFVALGFTTFFILKTMYPVEFGNIFGGQTQMHASEDITGTTETEIITGTELLPSEEISGAIETGTGAHESATDNGFGELNDLGAMTPELPQNDVSRLTDYVTQGNDFLTQGKAINNNTAIKYGLYISKKATAFLEKIANGEQINNLSGYFAQFDQYIAQVKELLGQTPAPDTTVTTPEEPVSPPPPANGIQEMTETTPTADTGVASD